MKLIRYPLQQFRSRLGFHKTKDESFSVFASGLWLVQALTHHYIITI